MWLRGLLRGAEQMTLLVGRNGAGKSTCWRNCISCRVRPASRRGEGSSILDYVVGRRGCRGYME